MIGFVWQTIQSEKFAELISQRLTGVIVQKTGLETYSSRTTTQEFVDRRKMIALDDVFGNEPKQMR